MVVGLGNTGRRYKNTRHNVGFMVAERLVQQSRVRLRRSFWLKADIARLKGEKDEILVLCPATYMNLSGKSVKKAKDKFFLPLENLLVICDDVNLPFGSLRLRAKGGAGGHKGLLSLIQELGSEQFSRLRIGVGRPQDKPLEKYVLEDFSSQEREALEEVIGRASKAVFAWIEQGIDKTMNLFN